MTYTQQVLPPLFQDLNKNIEFNNDICLIIEDLNNMMKQILNYTQNEYNHQYIKNNGLIQKYFAILDLKNISDVFMDVKNRKIPIEYLLSSIRPSLEYALKIVSKCPRIKTKFIQDKNIRGYYSQSSSYLHADYIINNSNYYYSCLEEGNFKNIELHLHIYIDILLIILEHYSLLPNEVNFEIMYFCIGNNYDFAYNIKPTKNGYR